jgi:predicted nuclease of predicted toxin-antitoxin system
VKFLLDESVERGIADFLERLGHDVIAVARDVPAGMPDRDVFTVGTREGRVLITNDTDFGELAARRGHAHHGVILFRLRATPVAEKVVALEHVLETVEMDATTLVVVTPTRVRVRRTPA